MVLPKLSWQGARLSRSPRCVAGCLAAVVWMAFGCTQPADFPFCSAQSDDDVPSVSRGITWHADVRPIVEARCTRCHVEGGIGPFPLSSYDDVFPMREAVRTAVVKRTMPPFLADDCCRDYQDDFSLSEEQIATIDAWVDQGAPEGDPEAVGQSLEPVGGLSRVDVEVEMPAPYLPEAPEGRVDDFRCFVLDWPLEEDVFITGMNPQPGARSIVHHLLIATVSGTPADEVETAASKFEKPGFPCEGGFGDIQIDNIIGGSLLGSNYPDGLGTKITGGSKIVLQVHYSMADAKAVEDRTAVQFRTSEEARETEGMVMANPAWLATDGMRIEAGAEDKSYRFQFRPRVFTGSRSGLIYGATPHMHYFGDKFLMGIVRTDGTKECLLEIPKWDFGWEQPFWFEEPVRIEPGDELYLECQFDNTTERQPIVDGKRQEPRDVAWGSENQDMCAGFLSWVPTED